MSDTLSNLAREHAREREHERALAHEQAKSQLLAEERERERVAARAASRELEQQQARYAQERHERELAERDKAAALERQRSAKLAELIKLKVANHHREREIYEERRREKQLAIRERDQVRQEIRASRQLGRDREREASSPSHGFGLALGLGILAVLGVGGLVLYLIFRKKDGSPVVVVDGAQLYGAPSATMLPPAPAQPQLPPHVQVLEARVVPRLEDDIIESKTRSFTLRGPEAGRNHAALIASTKNRMAQVTVRTIGPAGTFAIVASDPAALMDTRPIPVGPNGVIPVGQESTLYLNPGAALYARGNVPGVVISVITSPISGR